MADPLITFVPDGMSPAIFYGDIEKEANDANIDVGQMLAWASDPNVNAGWMEVSAPTQANPNGEKSFGILDPSGKHYSFDALTQAVASHASQIEAASSKVEAMTYTEVVSDGISPIKKNALQIPAIQNAFFKTAKNENLLSESDFENLNDTVDIVNKDQMQNKLSNYAGTIKSALSIMDQGEDPIQVISYVTANVMSDPAFKKASANEKISIIQRVSRTLSGAINAKRMQITARGIESLSKSEQAVGAAVHNSISQRKTIADVDPSTQESARLALEEAESRRAALEIQQAEITTNRTETIDAMQEFMATVLPNSSFGEDATVRQVERIARQGDGEQKKQAAALMQSYARVNFSLSKANNEMNKNDTEIRSTAELASGKIQINGAKITEVLAFELNETLFKLQSSPSKTAEWMKKQGYPPNDARGLQTTVINQTFQDLIKTSDPKRQAIFQAQQMNRLRSINKGTFEQDFPQEAADIRNLQAKIPKTSNEPTTQWASTVKSISNAILTGKKTGQIDGFINSASGFLDGVRPGTSDFLSNMNKGTIVKAAFDQKNERAERSAATKNLAETNISLAEEVKSVTGIARTNVEDAFIDVIKKISASDDLDIIDKAALIDYVLDSNAIGKYGSSVKGEQQKMTAKRKSFEVLSEAHKNYSVMTGDLSKWSEFASQYSAISRAIANGANPENTEEAANVTATRINSEADQIRQQLYNFNLATATTTRALEARRQVSQNQVKQGDGTTQFATEAEALAANLPAGAKIFVTETGKSGTVR